MRYARIDNGRAVEIINIQTPLAETFEPAFAARCFACGPAVAQGWLYDGRSFSSPPPPSAADLATARRVEILAELAALDDARVRPLAELALDPASAFARQKLAELESKAAALRAELAGLAASGD